MRPFNQGRHRRVDVFPQGIFSFSASMQAEIEARNNRELISSECAKPFHIPKGRAISFVVELDQCEYREKVYDDDGDGIYYDGKDKLISKILKTKSPAYIFVEHW